MWNEDVRTFPVRIGRLASYGQAAAVLDTSERQIGRMVEAGRLAGVRIGPRRYVTRKSLLGVLDGQGR